MAYKDISPSELTSSLLNEAAIKESVMNILMTRLGEVPGLPEFGSKIHNFLFEIEDSIFQTDFRNEVIYVLSRWEPRITVKKVDVILDTDYNRCLISIEYVLNKDIRNDYSSKFITFTVKR